MDRHEAFKEAIRKTHNLIFTIIYGYVKNIDKAEDLTQETYLRAFSSLDTLKDLGALKPWLCTIARNLVINWSEKNKIRQASKHIVAPSCEQSHQTRIEKQEAEHIVNKTLTELAPEDREILVMKYVGKMSYKEIADSLNISTSLVGVRVSRSLQKLRTRLLPFAGDLI